MFIKFVFCVVLVLCEAYDESNICTRTAIITSMQLIPETQTYIHSYIGFCTESDEDKFERSYGDYYDYRSEPRTYECTKTIQRFRIVQKERMKSSLRIIKDCCIGYSQVNISLQEGLVCGPNCNPPCKNGNCVAPDTCSCLSGYTLSLNESNTCLPICDKDCGHGTCVEPNTCNCDAGYELTNTTSNYACTKIIHNDTLCPLDTRYYNGTCIKPDCPDGCSNGICISRNVCKCNPGYQLVDDFFLKMKICEPECESGYTKIDGVCRPECKQSCGKGTCVKPNVCECFHDYKIDLRQLTSEATINGPLCIPVCRNCLGECVAPNTCITTTIPPPLSRFTTPISTTITRTSPEKISTTVPRLTTPIADTIITQTRTISTTPRTTTSTTTTPYDTSNDYKNKLSTVITAQFDRSIRYAYSTSPPTSRSTNIDHKYQNENKIDKVVDYTDTTNTTPPTIAESNRSKGVTTWLEQHWASVLLPIIIILLAAIVMLIVWRRAPIIIFLRGRSYAVEDDVPDDSDPQFEYSKTKEKVVCNYEHI